MISIYPSSKVKHAPMWRELQQKVPNVFFNARWLKRAEKESELSVDDMRHLWMECMQDISSSEALLLYAEDGDTLRGALVEVGMALAMGKPVVLAMDQKIMRDYGTWMHMDVTWTYSIEDAITFLGNMDVGNKVRWKR